MAEAYAHFMRFMRVYDDLRKQMDRQNGLLMQRMVQGRPDALLRTDLKMYYDGCYASWGQGGVFPEEGDLHFDCAAVMDCLAQDGINNGHLARWCGVSKAQITKWKKGTKPRKHVWWMIALYTRLPLELLPAFLAIADSAYDPLCRRDVIMLHGQLMKYSISEIMRQLEENHCPIREERTVYDV